MTTQYATASYQEIIDLHTESDHVSVVGIHTPNSDTPYHMLRGFWTQFKKFKYNGCSLSLVPAAQLPVDPLQVSYDAGEPTIDSRDMLNPILFHGCHGNDMGAILNSLYAGGTSGVIPHQDSDSVDFNEFASSSQYATDLYESLYYRALTDNTWLKAHPQRGFRKNGLHPMVYSVASSVQMNPIAISAANGFKYPIGTSHSDDGTESKSYDGPLGIWEQSDTVYATQGFGRPDVSTDGGLHFEMDPDRSMVQFFTPRLQRLGWMDTHQVIGASSSVSSGTPTSSKKDVADMYLSAANQLKPVSLGKLFMGMIMLPPAYKTEQYFRLILNHSFSFAKFRGASMQYQNVGEIANCYTAFNFNDPESKKGDDDDPEPPYKE